MQNQQYYMPTLLIAGVVGGLVGATPCLNIVNCCFGLPAIVAALVAVSLVVKKAGQRVELGEGAIIGLIVGSISGLITGLGTAAMQLIGFGMSSSNPIFANNPDLQRQMGDMAASGAAMAFGSFCCWFVAFVLFGCIGGMIGSAIFKPPAPPAPYGYGGIGGGPQGT